MLQLDIFQEIPKVEKKYFLDIYGMSYFDKKFKKIRLMTMEWENTPKDIAISHSKKYLEKYPVGTIFKLDAKLVLQKNGHKYLSALHRKDIRPALEFFVHNRNLI